MSKNRKLSVEVHTSMTGVSGSRYLVNIRFTNGVTSKILIDCGRENTEDGNEPFDDFFFNPESLDCVCITHSHLDHYGDLGKLFNQGANCPIYCSEGTAALLPISLINSHTVDLIKRGNRKKNLLPYDWTDIETCISKLDGHPYNEEIIIEKVHGYSVTIKFLYNAHIPGASMIELTISDAQDPVPQFFLFSGDYKEHSDMCTEEKIPPELFKLPINLFIESTYGGVPDVVIRETLIDKIVANITEGQKIIIPCISLRLPKILLDLSLAQRDGRLSQNIPIYVDAPLGLSYSSIMKHDDRIHLRKECQNFGNNYVSSNSQKISKKPAIYLVGGGMGYGPSQPYILEALGRSDCTIIFSCYQVEGTVGRKILDASQEYEVELFGSTFIKEAKIDQANEYSGHAHQEELLKFVKKFTNLQSIAVTHGSPENRKNFIDILSNEFSDKLSIQNFDKNVYFVYRENQLRNIKNSKITSMSLEFNKLRIKEERKLKTRKRRSKKNKRHNRNNRKYDSQNFSSVHIS